MRLAGQMKSGFYAVDPAVPVALADRLRVLKPDETNVIDPCAGEGVALGRLADALGIERERAYAVEVDEGRSEIVNHPDNGWNAQAPCSLFDLGCTPRSMSLVWCNPPFDDEAGGGERIEHQFLVRATDLLVAGGVMAFFCPSRLFDAWYRPTPQFFVREFEKIAVLEPDPEHRPYDEVLVVGTRRKRPYHDGKFDAPTIKLSGCDRTWDVPPAKLPKRFDKCGLTPDEIERALRSSPLNSLTAVPEIAPPARPPLPLAKGHIALLLASGHLDGIVRPEGEPPHVVRGTARKVLCDPEVTHDYNPETGGTKTVTTINERIQLVVRAIDADGELKTFE